MNATSLLTVVGQVAGIGGLALGVLLLVFRDVIRKNIFPELAADHAYRIIQLIIVLTFSVAAIGIAAWVYVSTRELGPDRTSFYKSSPRLISPDSEAKLDLYPRVTSYSWHAIDGAEKYLVEVEYFDASTNLWNPLPAGTGRVFANSPSATSGFVGAQQGRWRVTAFNPQGERGQSSEWRTFVYQR